MNLLERDAELAVIAELTARAGRGLGSCVVVSGTAGIGKTVLLSHLADDTGALRATGGELEDDVPFGVVRELLAKLVAGQGALSDAAALCAPVFDPGRRGGDPSAGAVLHGLYWLVADAAETEPLTLVVDDVQWADPASVRFLAYLARRIGDLRCTLALGLRVGPRGGVRADVDALVALPSVRRISLAALTAGAVSTLVTAALGTTVDPSFADACVAATGGNPLLCVALAGELARRRVQGSAAERPAVEQAGAVGVVESIRRRIARCGAAAARVGVAAAILGPSATYRRVRALAEVEDAQATGAIEALVAESVLEDARPLRFTHPLVRAAVLDDVPEGARARWHTAAARLLDDEGADELAAHHLRLGEPLGDPQAVAVLRRAAARALDRGASDVAVAYLERAIAEPPPAGQRAPLLYELGLAESYAGLPPAIGHLEAALDSTDDPALAVRIAHALGDAQMWAGMWQESVLSLERGIDVAPDAASATVLRGQILRAATGSARVRRLTGERLAELRGRDGFAADERLAMGLLAIDLAMTTGPVQRIVDLARRALEDGTLLDGGQPEGIHELTATALALADDAPTALHAFDAALDQARRRGDAMRYARGSTLRAWAMLRFGRPAEAEADARNALELDQAARFNAVLLPMAVGTLIGAELEIRGAAAARAVADAYPSVAADADGAGGQPLPIARAELALAERRPDLALAELEICRDWEREFSGSCAGFASWRPVAVSAHLMRGEHAEAAALAATQSELAHVFGGPTALGVARHTSALVARDASAMGQAVAFLRGSPARTLLVRALTDHGALLRGLHQPAAARIPLREALELADEAGADALAQRALDELQAAGARPRRRRMTGLDALTAGERRAVRMAAEGLTNRQIAQAGFVSPRTIEMHLSNAYRKLDVDGRGDLAARLETLGDAAVR